MWFLDCKVKASKIIVLSIVYALYANYLIHISDAMCITKDVFSSCFQVMIVEDASPLANMLQ